MATHKWESEFCFGFLFEIKTQKEQLARCVVSLRCPVKTTLGKTLEKLWVRSSLDEDDAWDDDDSQYKHENDDSQQTQGIHGNLS